MALLEIAAFNVESALIADKAGADRIELCSGLAAGGLTASLGDIQSAKQELTCPFFVMIRPKGGDFVYSAEEFAIMKESLMQAKTNGAAGFVFGIMKEHGDIDEAANKELVALASPLRCTFHRAFDDIENKAAALETLIACGFARVLTSGGIGNAVNYCDELQQLVKQANGRIIVMPGGGIRTNNLNKIKTETGALEYHSAALDPNTQLADPEIIKEMKKQLKPISIVQ